MVIRDKILGTMEITDLQGGGYELRKPTKLNKDGVMNYSTLGYYSTVEGALDGALKQELLTRGVGFVYSIKDYIKQIRLLKEELTKTIKDD